MDSSAGFSTPTESSLCYLLVLLQENARLRKIVGSLSDFIGKGSGGAAHRIGLTEEGLQAIGKEGFFDLLAREASNLDAVAQEAQRGASSSAVYQEAMALAPAGTLGQSYISTGQLMNGFLAEGQRQEQYSSLSENTAPFNDSLDAIDPSLASIPVPGPSVPELSFDALLAPDSLSPALQDLLKQFTQPDAAEN